MIRFSTIVFLMLIFSYCGAAPVDNKDNPWTQSSDPIGPQQEANLTGLSVFVEQDLLYSARNEDRNYTMGVGFQSSGRWIQNLHLDLPRNLLEDVTGVGSFMDEWLLRQGTDAIVSNSLLFGNTAFTPDSLQVMHVLPDDRPYSSLLFLSTARAIVAADRRSMWRSELTLGLLGLDLARSIQTSIHQWNRGKSGKETPFDPAGWQNQISDGGEPTLRMGLAYQRNTSERRYFDSTVKFDGNLGYFTNASAGLWLRFGKIESPWYRFDSAPMSQQSEILPTKEQHGIRGTSNLELFGWASGRARVIGYNALLQGQFRESLHTLDPGQIERFLWEFETGITGAWKRLSVTWVIVAGRTSEHRLGAPRTHFWGSLFLQYRFGD